MHKRLIIALAVLALAVASCGDDDAGTTTGAGGTTGAGETTTNDAATTAAAGGLSCDGLLSLDDVATLFGEPADLDEEASEEGAGLDTVSCVWSSIEDPDDLEDLQVQLFQVQVYRGEQYYAPDIAFEEVEPIAGIGDDAFFSPQLGVSTGFKDGDRVAFVTFSVIGMGDAPDSITKKDQVIDLLRLVHDRVV